MNESLASSTVAVPLLSVRGLSKSYSGFKTPGRRLAHTLFGSFLTIRRTVYQALDDVSFDLYPGEALAVIGRNGAGKSTLLQIVSGVLTPTAGEVTAPARTVGLLELGSGFNPEFTGRENIYLNAAILELSPQEIRDRIDDVIAFADIGDYIDQPVKTYSAGMFLRLAFSIATSVQPDLLLVDEALGVGDIFFRQKCYAHLDAMRGRGMAVVLVTHSMVDAAEFCNRGIVLSRGHIMYAGSGKEAVEYYFHHERETPTGRITEKRDEVPAPGSATLVGLEGHRADRTWEKDPAAVDLTAKEQFGSDGAQALHLLVSNLSDNPEPMFEQGDWMRIRANFLVRVPLERALLGIELRNQRDVLVHGKNGLNIADAAPAGISAGSVLTVIYEIKLNVDVGEYTLDVALAEVDEEAYRRRGEMPPAELMSHVHLLRHVSDAAAISVVPPRIGSPCTIGHYGVADLPGRFAVEVAPASVEKIC